VYFDLDLLIWITCISEKVVLRGYKPLPRVSSGGEARENRDEREASREDRAELAEGESSVNNVFNERIVICEQREQCV